MKAIELLTRIYDSRHEAPVDGATAERILDAAARQLELFGIQRTTMEDVARRAGVSRVTVYRRFPNKEQLLEAVVRRDVSAFLVDLAACVEGIDDDLERIVEGFVFSIATLRRHTLLQRLLESEPELLLPQLTTGAGPILSFATRLIVDYVTTRMPELPHDDVVAGAEVGIRLGLSLVLTPDSALDLDDAEAIRGIVRRFAAPLLEGIAPPGAHR